LQDKRVANPKEGDREDFQLGELGLDAAAPADAALARLAELRKSAQVSNVAIARALAKIEHPGAAAMLAEMEAGAGGVLRREVRRALFKLRQKGIAPPEPPPLQLPRGPAAAAEPAGLSALLSPIDPEGARLVWILKSRAQGGVARLWGLVSEQEGLVGANVANLSRRELRQEREDLERRAALRLIEADWRLADFILCEAYRRTPEERRGQVGNFLALRAELIASAAPAELVHPVYKELAAEATGEPSIELLKEPELLQWRLPEADLRPYLDEINRSRDSLIVVSPVQQQERIESVIQRAIDELLSGARGARIRRHLEDLAYHLARTGRRTQAGWAAAAAAKIRDGAELKRIAFFQGFVRAQLAITAAAEQERAREEPHLIMTPAEAMRASEAARARRR
jgi:hypothetical protein